MSSRCSVLCHALPCNFSSLANLAETVILQRAECLLDCLSPRPLPHGCCAAVILLRRHLRCQPQLCGVYTCVEQQLQLDTPTGTEGDWCVPLQLPSPCYDTVHNPRVLHMQCVTCILPHLGLQVTPGNTAPLLPTCSVSCYSCSTAQVLGSSGVPCHSTCFKASLALQ